MKYISEEKIKDCQRIGIFDSGVGGLSVLQKLREAFGRTSENKEIKRKIIYLADTGRFPYGAKSAETIRAYTQQIIHWLEQQNVDLIIFGCNTANAAVYKNVSNLTNLPIIDLIGPTAQYVSQLGLNVGVLATETTIRSQVFSKAIKELAPCLPVKEIASAELVNIVETGAIKGKETEKLLANYIDQFIAAQTQLIVLGCTHFSFLKNSLLPLVGSRMQILDPAELIGNLICSNQSFRLDGNEIETSFFVTGNTENFAKIANICMGYTLKNVNHLPLESLVSIEQKIYDR